MIVAVVLGRSREHHGLGAEGPSGNSERETEGERERGREREREPITQRKKEKSP